MTPLAPLCTCAEYDAATPAQQRAHETQQAVKELQGIFPSAPTRPPEGSDGEFSTYQHILVCFLEYRAVQQLLGELKARQVMEFWTADHYRVAVDRDCLGRAQEGDHPRNFLCVDKSP